MAEQLDSFLSKIKKKGFYQWISIVLLTLNVNNLIGFNYAWVFFSQSPGHTCKIPNESPWTKNESIPFKTSLRNESIYDSCTKYLDPANVSLGLTSCNSSYEYSDGASVSIPKKWDLVCDKFYLVRIHQLLYFLGVTLGSLVGGYLSDEYGRRPVVIGGVTMACILNSAIYFTGNYVGVVILTFLSGIVMQIACHVSLTLMNELLPSNNRSKISVLCVALNMAMVFLFIPVAQNASSFPQMWLALTTPCYLSLSAFWFIPESVKWLLCNERLKSAKYWVKRFAKLDRVQLEENYYEELCEINKKLIEERQSRDEKETFRNMMKNKRIRIIVISYSIFAFVGQMSAYGVAFMAQNVYMDVYLTMYLMIGTDFICRLCTYYPLKKYSRKFNLIAAQSILCFTNVGCVIVNVITDSGAADLKILSLCAGVFGRLGTGLYWSIFILYNYELFPTTIRTKSASIPFSVGRSATFVLPLILLMGDYVWKYLPFVVFAVSNGIAIILAIAYLPEIKSITPPNTINEMISNLSSRNRKQKSVL